MRKFPFAILFLCLAAFSLVKQPLFAANENMLADYGIRQWRGEDGLGEDIVNGVEQARDGYIWCVTQNHILKFDGQRFTQIDQDAGRNAAWRGVVVDHRGALWFYGEDGIQKYDGHRWTSFFQEKGRPKVPILTVEEDPRGVVWAAGEQGIYRFDPVKPALFPCPSEEKLTDIDVGPDGQIVAIARGPRGTRLLRFHGGAYTPEDLPPEYEKEELLKVHLGPSGTLWVITARHLVSRSAGNWMSIPFPDGQTDGYGIRNIMERQGGELWIGSLRGLFRWRGETWSELTTRDGFFPFAVRFIKEDREGGLWVAGTGGLMRLTPKAVQVFTSGLGVQEREPFISLLVAGPEWWVGISGLSPLEGMPGQFAPAALGAYPSDTTASALLKTRDGALWIGTHTRNLWRWKNGKAEMISPQKDADIPLSAITALMQDRSGKIWAGTLGGLSVVTPGGLVPADVGLWHPKDTVNTLYEDKDGTLWVGYQTLGLLKLLRNGSAVWFQKGEGLPDNSVRAVYRDKAGTLWVGTASGLMRWVKNRQSVFTVAEGLADDAIRQIIEDDFGYLWLGTRSGLMRINLAEFPEVDGGTKAALAVRCFGRGDGMKTEECSATRPVKTEDGRLWFPTADGLVMADPRALPKTTETPHVYLEEVRISGNPVWTAVGNSNGRSLFFPKQPREVEFRFASPDYFAPDRVRFKYRVEGLDPDWSAPSPSRSAVYRDMPPGNYRFRVAACSRDGVWSTTESSLVFTVPPTFWQTLAFRAAAGILGVLTLVVFFVWRERLNTRRKLRELEHEQMVERERARIARDIHDEVGAGLTEVALLSELAQANLKEGPKYLDDIFQTARDLTRSLDEIVWSINPANDTLEKLISYLVEFSRDFLGTASLPCRLEVPTMVPPVTVASTVRHQICLAVKETLHNIVKHAEASEVHMEIRWEGARLQIRVTDNGRGFARAAIDDPASTRDGLGNLTARMSEIGGRCEQQSEIGKGTCTILSVEIPTAIGPRHEP